MRRLLITSLTLCTTALLPLSASSQTRIPPADGSLTGTREIGVFASGRILSTAYSVSDARSAFGTALTFGTHFKRSFAVQGGLAMSYGKQLNSYYKPPLFTFTPTISLLLQRSTAADFQPYGLIGAGYEFVRFTHPRCDCDQSQSYGVGNLGFGFRKMLGASRAFRAEVSTQIGSAAPAFTGIAGMSFFIGAPARVKQMRVPDRVRSEPPLIPIPKQTSTSSGNRTTTAPPAAAPVTQPPVTTNRPVTPSNLPTGIGAVLLQIDGTQVDFSKTNWRDDAEPLLDGLVVDLTSDAGQSVKLSVEAHTDNVGSNAGNIMLGLDRARAVRDYLVSQGVAADRIRISSAGEDAPIAPNTTAIGRQQNRRIVIKREN
jgi:outer membrane protein OmpA-like peptidoglycan-associated protein